MGERNLRRWGGGIILKMLDKKKEKQKGARSEKMKIWVRDELICGIKKRRTHEERVREDKKEKGDRTRHGKNVTGGSYQRPG